MAETVSANQYALLRGVAQKQVRTVQALEGIHNGTARSLVLRGYLAAENGKLNLTDGGMKIVGLYRAGPLPKRNAPKPITDRLSDLLRERKARDVGRWVGKEPPAAPEARP